MVELYSNYLSDDKLDFIEKIYSNHKYNAEFLRKLILENHGIPDDRAAVSLFEFSNYATRLCHHLPSPLKEKAFIQGALQSEKSLKLRYNKLLKFSPPKDKQAIMQLKICISSHIAHIENAIHSNG